MKSRIFIISASLIIAVAIAFGLWVAQGSVKVDPKVSETAVVATLIPTIVPATPNANESVATQQAIKVMTQMPKELAKTPAVQPTENK